MEPLLRFFETLISEVAGRGRNKYERTSRDGVHGDAIPNPVSHDA